MPPGGACSSKPAGPRRDAKATRGKWFRRMTTMAACIAAGSGGTYWWLVTNGYRAERRAAYAEAPRHEDFLVGGNGVLRTGGQKSQNP